MPCYHGDGKVHVNESDFVMADSSRTDLLSNYNLLIPVLVPLQLLRAARDSVHLSLNLPLNACNLPSPAFFPTEFRSELLDTFAFTHNLKKSSDEG